MAGKPAPEITLRDIGIDFHLPIHDKYTQFAVS